MTQESAEQQALMESITGALSNHGRVRVEAVQSDSGIEIK